MSCELLSPAGNYECMLAAINAGCDAIYAGTDRFSARAYAGNLSSEEFIKGIKRAHLNGIRVYLTLNTLIFESELPDAIQTIRQLYESGLDGIIIQDMGLIQPLRESFPGLSIHASTQMSIMNQEGAMALKKLGFERVVPARELCLEELRSIKNKTGIELECFIHGAMCYSYSGMCLMSSMIGDRSGNRGRCAGTCRLPFCATYLSDGHSEEEYPLSMKDLCALELIPELIDAGIDSFKIEGRMKSPEYVAGVTEVYRRAIDSYLTLGPDRYSMNKDDLKQLKSLYIRTQISQGYLNGAFGRELITFDLPGYSGSDDHLIKSLNERYVHEPEKLRVDISAHIHRDKEIEVTYSYKEYSVTLHAPAPDTAQKKPVTVYDCKDKLSGLGDTFFYAGQIDIELDDGLFIPVSVLKDLKRSAVNKLTKIISADKLGGNRSGKAVDIPSGTMSSVSDNTKASTDTSKKVSNMAPVPVYDVSVSMSDQLMETLDLAEHTGRIILDHKLLIDADESRTDKLVACGNDIYMSLPPVFRERSAAYFESISRFLSSEGSGYIKGVMVHTLDELYYINKQFPQLKIITGPHLYACNSSSLTFLSGQGNIDTVILPYELSRPDMRDMLDNSAVPICTEFIVYGYIPMMISAGCIKKTYGRCDHRRSYDDAVSLTDRKNKTFHVFTDCSTCTNIIYNCVPLSLHNIKEQLFKAGAGRACINLTMEDEATARTVLNAFLLNDEKSICTLSDLDHTTGHIKRRIL